MHILITLAAIAAVAGLAACNTISGAGRDIQAVGHAVTRTADSH